MKPRIPQRMDCRDESGAVVILVAVALTFLLGLVALVVDLGALYDHDRDIQTMADAAALAGAQELVYTDGDPTAAEAMARGYASSNAKASSAGSSVVEANVAWRELAITDSSVTVDLLETQVPFVFAPVIGQREGSVHARARAEVKYLRGVQNLFPVALLYMRPDKFRFIVDGVGSFDIVDTDGDGTYGESGEGGTTLGGASTGLHDVTLDAIGKVDGAEVAVLTLPDIGAWWVSDPDPANPNPTSATELLYRVGMSRSIGGNIIDVSVQVAPTATSVTATLGGRNVGLTAQGGGLYTGGVTAPSTNSNDGYDAFDLVVTIETEDPAAKGKGGGKKKIDITAGRVIAFHPDVPLEYLMLTPTFTGHSRNNDEGAEFQSATIVTRTLTMGQTYVLKLGNQEGSGLYSGNWRSADIWLRQNLADEIAAVDIPPGWELTIDPLEIGGPLKPEAGAKVGQVIHGLDDRLAPWGNDAPMDDPRRVVIVPIVQYAPDLHGTSSNYTIVAFAAFRITDYSDHGQDKGDIEGEFIEWVAPGSWQDTPPGPVYVKTIVLTE